MTNKLVDYRINGKLFRDLNIYVKSSSGLLDLPKPKPRKTYNWAGLNGRQVATDATVYDEREINLSCWIRGDNWIEIEKKFTEFVQEFQKGRARLLVDFGKTLVFDVYISDGIKLEKRFSLETMVGTFNLKLKEPLPMKRILKFQKGDYKITFCTLGHIEVITDTEIIQTEKGKNIIGRTAHAETFVTLAGDINDILHITHNGEEVW